MPRERKTRATTGHNGVSDSTVAALETVTGAKMLKRVASGMTITEAAESLDLTRQTGSRIYHAELRRASEAISGLRQDLLVQELETCRLLLRTFMAKALRGDYHSAQIVLATLDRRAKYLALDAAVKIEVSNERINETVEGIVALLDAANGELPTILEAETGTG